LGAGLKLALKDPNIDGRLTWDEWSTKSIGDLVSIQCDPSSYAKLDLTLAAGLAGLTGDLARLTLNDTNLCDGIDTPGLQVMEPKLADFSTMKPTDVVNVLIALIDALETLEKRGDVQLPFLKEKLSHAVELSKRLLAFLDENDFIDPQKPLDQQPPLDQAKQDKIATFDKLAKLLVDYLEAQGITLPNGLNLRYDAAKRRLLLDLKLQGGPPDTTVSEDFDLTLLGRAGLIDVVTTGKAEVKPSYSVDLTAGIDLMPDPPNAPTSALKTIPQRVLIKTSGAAISVDAPVQAKLDATGRIGIVGVNAKLDDGSGGVVTLLERKDVNEPMFKLALTGGGADGFATLHDLFSGNANSFGVTPTINAKVSERKIEAVATVGEGAAKTELARGKVSVKWDDLTQPSTLQVTGDADFNKKLFRFDFDRHNPRALLGLILTTIRDGMDQVNRLARDNEKLTRSLPVVGAGYDDMVGTFVKIRDFADQLNTLNQNLTLQGLEEAIEDELVKAFGFTEAQAADLLDLELDTSQARTALLVRLRFCQASVKSTDCQGTAQPVKGRFALDVPGGGIAAFDTSGDVQLDYLAQGELALGVELPELVPGTSSNPVPALKTGEQPARAFIRGSTGLSLAVKGTIQGQAAATLGPFTVALGQPTDQFVAKAAAGYSIGTGGSATARLSPAAWAQQTLNRLTTGPFTIHPEISDKVNCGAPSGTFDACARVPVYFQKTGTPSKLGEITFTTDDLLAGPFNFAGHQQVLAAFANEALKFSTWIEGLRWLVDRAKQSLDGASVGQQLPLVGKSFAAGAETLTKLNAFLGEVQGLVTQAESAVDAGSLRTKITNFLNQKLGSGVGGLNILRAPVTVTILCGANPCLDNALPPAFSDVRLSVPLGQTGATGTTPFSFGFPGMRIQSASSLNATASWQLDLVFGADRQGFYLDTSGQELTAGIGIDLPDTINAEIAFLPVTITDIDPTGTTTAKELDVELGFDIKKGDPVTKKLYLSQILRDGFSFTNRNDVAFTIKGCADIDLGLELKPDAGLPSLKADLDLLAEWGGCLPTATGVDLRDGIAPVTTIKLKDVKFMLGTTLTNYMRPAVEQLQRFTRPVQPIIDKVRAPIPVVTDLGSLVGQPQITWWDAFKAYIAAQGATPPTGVFPSQGNSVAFIDTLMNLS
ncbi:MAG: hypothetical protein WD670_08460, partial [Actinomycetota bacterium]